MRLMRFDHFSWHVSCASISHDFLMRWRIWGNFLMRWGIFTLFAWQPASEAWKKRQPALGGGPNCRPKEWPAFFAKLNGPIDSALSLNRNVSHIIKEDINVMCVVLHSLFILLSKCTKLMHFTIKCRKCSPGGACPRTPLGECGSLKKCGPTNVRI